MSFQTKTPSLVSSRCGLFWSTFALLQICLFSSPAVALEKTASAPTTHRTIDAILFYGQSNAGAGGEAKPLLISPVFPETVFTFHSAQQTYGAHPVDPQRLASTGAIQDDVRYAPFPATAMAYALAKSSLSSTQAYFIHTVWYGGQPLTSFLPGTTAWLDLTVVVDRMAQVLPDRDWQRRVAALVFIQGEAGPGARQVYSGLLSQFLDQALPDIKRRTGQASLPMAILLQTNESNAMPLAIAGAALAQWDVAKARPQDAILAAPMYQLPLSDAVHQSTTGRMMLGDLLSVVFQSRVERGETFEPLHPVGARILNDTIKVTFKRPKDSLPIRWDREWVPSAPDYGFSLKSETGPVHIAAVEITGPSEVTIRLGRQESSRNLVLSYAMTPAPVEGWTAKRGQLMAPTKIHSAFSGMDLSVPQEIAHYCIRFEIPVL